MKLHGIRFAGALLVALLTLAGCGILRSGDGATPAPTTMPDAEVLAIGKQIAQCIRDHGIPDMPDPIVDENHHIQLPEGTEEQLEGSYPEATLQQAQQACQSLFDQLPESAVRSNDGGDNNSGDDVPGPEDQDALRQFAACVREQGIAEFPDPRADGTFPVIGTPLENQAKSQRLIDAYLACGKYWSGQIGFS